MISFYSDHEKTEKLVKRFATIEFGQAELAERFSAALVFENLREKYAKKFCPYTMKSINFEGFEGYEVRLPFFECEQKDEAMKLVIKKLFSDLLSLGIDIVYPKIVLPEFETKIKIADGKGILKFFCVQAAELAAKKQGLEIAVCEVTVLDEYGKNLSVLIPLSQKANYINVLSNGDSGEILSELSLSSGLSSGISGFEKKFVRPSDIYISFSDIGSMVYMLGRNSVLADFSGNDAVKYIAEKRSDLFIIDGFHIKYGEKTFSPEVFELLMLLKSKNYRYLYTKKSCLRIEKFILDEISSWSARVCAVTKFGKRIY